MLKSDTDMGKRNDTNEVHGTRRKPSPHDYRLYFVTDSRLHKGYSVLEQVALALEGGVKIIQIREKEMVPGDYAALISAALMLTRQHGAYLIVNDLPAIAASTGADGIHLGQDDMAVKAARELLGQDAIIGISVKTPEEAVKGEKDGADYIAVNGVFPTSTKRDLGYCPGLEGVTRICRSTSLPVVGIGGITLHNCRSVLEAGAQGIAVVTALTMAEHIPTACRNLWERLSDERQLSGSQVRKGP
ncbi:MAG TPA: thiamine phosphate synthase [Syntrophorhabdaceae bacterium]|jgi:thiamine-phosphate pyrophosphorylase